MKMFIHLVCYAGSAVNYNWGLSAFAAWTWLQPESIRENAVQRRE